MQQTVSGSISNTATSMGLTTLIVFLGEGANCRKSATTNQKLRGSGAETCSSAKEEEGPEVEGVLRWQGPEEPGG